MKPNCGGGRSMYNPPSPKRPRTAGGSAAVVMPADIFQQAQGTQAENPEANKLLLMLSKMNGPQGAKAQM